MKRTTLALVEDINENTYIPSTTENNLFELFQLDTIADLRKVSRNFLKLALILNHLDDSTAIATAETAGIVKFGLENGNAVDVKDWIKSVGGILGGYVSEVENKELNKWYINDLTDGKIYKCIQAHSSTSFDLTKYQDISNIGISNKLENLFTIEKLNITQGKIINIRDMKNNDIYFIYVRLPNEIGALQFTMFANGNYNVSDTQANNLVLRMDARAKNLTLTTVSAYNDSVISQIFRMRLNV